MKNDITYEYRVFTHRLIDVESMEVGICTSKVIKEIKPKDKVNGRFFHTSDTDEWFFCWNNELQKLNLKGNSDVNAALAEVEKLISDANAAVEDAKKTATEAKNAAAEAKTAADAASAAVESIENKADKSEVEAVSKAVEAKADKSVVDTLSAKVDAIKVPSLDEYATKDFVSEEIKKEVPTKVSAFENDANYLTSHQDISGKQDVIEDLADIRSGAALGATALQEVPSEYVTEEGLSTKGYLTAADADLKYAPIGSEGVDLGDYATKDFVSEEIKKLDIPTIPTKVSEFINDAGYLTAHQDISGKQDVIVDLDVIRANAELAKTALQEVPAEYVTEEELAAKGYLTSVNMDGKQDVIEDLADIRSGAALGATALQAVPEEYVTEEELSAKGYLTEHQDISGKQDVIEDLTTIRSNAEKGATALQEVPAEYVTEKELENKGYLTEHQSLDNYYTKGDIDALIGDVKSYIKDTILA